jgi:hypothetical protein
MHGDAQPILHLESDSRKGRSVVSLISNRWHKLKPPLSPERGARRVGCSQPAPDGGLSRLLPDLIRPILAFSCALRVDQQPRVCEREQGERSGLSF